MLYGNYLSPRANDAVVLRNSNHEVCDEIGRGVLCHNLAAKGVRGKLDNHGWASVDRSCPLEEAVFGLDVGYVWSY